jgi:hypothetical protein
MNQIAVAWASGLSAEEIQDVHFCEWVLLAGSVSQAAELNT